LAVGVVMFAGCFALAAARAAEPFMGAYMNIPLLFDAQADQAARERSIAENLDRFQQSGLKVMIPFVVDGGKAAMYPSQVVGNMPYHDWDPLAVMVREGRQRGLQIYPAICVLSCGHKTLGSPLKEHPEWAVRDKAGQPLGFISPGHPEARKWVLAMIKEVAVNYQPEGVLLDYLRYPGNEAQMDPVSQAQFDQTHPATQFPRNGVLYREELLKFKRQTLTELVGQISEMLRSLRPTPRIAIYMWGAQELKGTRDWRTWADRGYIDMLNLTGYYFAKRNGDKYREVLEQHFQEVQSILKEVNKPVEFTICVGIKTSHGEIQATRDIQDYLQIGKRCGVHGAAFFTWAYLQPHLAEVKQAGYLEQFVSGLPPRP
jgi:uncharacterized lipoprotein YddW (UPF0748 family)